MGVSCIKDVTKRKVKRYLFVSTIRCKLIAMISLCLRYYVYQRFSLIKEGPVADFGLPADATVDAALQWQGSSRTPWTAGTKTYLFTGTKYYRYDEITKRIDRYVQTSPRHRRSLQCCEMTTVFHEH